MAIDLKPLSIRVMQADLDRLDALAARLPMTTKTALAREALRRGMEILERAADAPGELGKLAALASLSEPEKPKAKPSRRSEAKR